MPPAVFALTFSVHSAEETEEKLPTQGVHKCRQHMTGGGQTEREKGEGQEDVRVPSVTGLRVEMTSLKKNTSIYKPSP